MTVAGILASFMSLIIALIYFVYKITHWNSFSVGIAPLVIGLFFFTSVQLLCIGILGGEQH
jgi:cell shape-determining protein MreD